MGGDAESTEPLVPSRKCADGYTRPIDIEKEVERSLHGVTRVHEQLGLAPLRHETGPPPPNAPCIVFLGEEDGIRITHMREGGRVSPNNVFQVLDPSWFTFDPERRTPVGEGTHPYTEGEKESDRERKKLYLLKGISFDRFGHTPTMWTYDPPRLVTYLVQGFTMARTGSYRDDGMPLERHADTPLCSSCKLEVVTSDKLHTRILLACNQVGFPATLAFVYKPVVVHRTMAELAVQVHELGELTGDATKRMVEARTREWIESNPALRRLVVKPSGPTFQQSFGVSFHDATRVDEVVAAVLALVAQLGPSDCVLVDEFLVPMPPRIVVNAREAALVTALRGKQPSRSKNFMSVEDHLHVSKIARPGLGHRLRVVVQRTLDNQCRVVSIICGVGDISAPIGGHNTIARTFSQFCDTWGISKGEPRDEAYRAVCVEGERTLQAIIEAEDNMSVEEKGSPAAQTDSIGIDMILSMRNGVIVPIVIECNDYDSTSQAQELEYCIPRLHGSVVNTWMVTAVARSVRYLMHGKRVLVVCGGHPEVERAATEATQLGSLLTVVTPNEQCVSAEGRAALEEGKHRLVVVPGISCTEAEESAAAVAAAVGEGERFDGVVGFCSTLGPVVRSLSRRFTGGAAASECAGIAQFQRALIASYAEPMWHTVNPPLLVLKHRLVRTADEADAAVKALRVPLSVRPDVAVGQIGAHLAFNAEAATEQARSLVERLAARRDAAKFAVGDAVLLAEYRDSSLHDVYVVMHSGELVAGFMADVGPPNLPQCDGPTAYRLPTREDVDTESSLVNTTHFVLRQMAVGDGVYRCRWQLRATLPNMVSLDTCAGGDFMSEWCQRVYGYSLCEAALALSCGIRPAVPTVRVRKHLIGAVLYESRHARCTDAEGMQYMRSLADRDVLAMWPLDRVSVGGGTVIEGNEEPKCLVACFGDSRDEAESALRTALDVLAVDGVGEAGETTWFVSNM